LPSLKLEDYSDHELLALVGDLADATGFVTSTAIGEALGEAGSKLGQPARNVSIRLSWLKRYGVMETAEIEEDGKRLRGWRVTPEGEAMLSGSLRKQHQEALEGLSEDKVLSLARLFGQRYARAGGMAAKMMEREFKYSMGVRKRTVVAPPAQRAMSTGKRRGVVRKKAA
jgi:hypothetical protein